MRPACGGDAMTSTRTSESRSGVFSRHIQKTPMSCRLILSTAASLVFCCVVVVAQRGTGPSPAEGTLTEQVRSAEIAFAKSMADRDAAAFASLIGDEAVFFGNQSVMRGKTEVVAGWKRFFDGAAAPFSWKPTEVEVLASGTLAMTSGPVFDPNGARIGTFNSIWQRQADGSWKVIFDKGCPPCGDCSAKQ
jgi:ketosteroid isomerase-like protein